MADVISNTPYDDAFKTMYVECDELVYPLLNEVFGEHYSGNEKIIRRGNEFFENEEDQKFGNVRKGMGEIMGGHVLDSVVIRARDEGIQKGIEKGIEKGKTALADAIMKIHAGATVEDLIKEGVDEDTANLAWTCR